MSNLINIAENMVSVTDLYIADVSNIYIFSHQHFYCLYDQACLAYLFYFMSLSITLWDLSDKQQRGGMFVGKKINKSV